MHEVIAAGEEPWRWLVPLYRLAPRPGRPCGRRLSLEDISDGSLRKFVRATPRFADLLSLGFLHAYDVFVAKRGNTIVAACTVNGAGEGEVGEFAFLADCTDEVISEASTAALFALRDQGHKYAVVSRHLSASLQSIATKIADGQSLSPKTRDIQSPWADIFFPLINRKTKFTDMITVADACIRIRPARPSEHIDVVQSIARDWGRGWASEMEAALVRSPSTAIIAVPASQESGARFNLHAFMAYNVTAPGFTSTTAIAPSMQGVSLELAGALFDRVLDELASRGHRFAILGGVSRRAALLRASRNSFAIPGSYPGVFHGKDPVLEPPDGGG